MREKVYGELVRIANMDVITKVTEPKKWCSGMVVVPKALRTRNLKVPTKS